SGTDGATYPALFNSRRHVPNASFVFRKSSCTGAGSVTSVGIASSRAPDGLPSSAVSASASGRRPASATDQPSFASASATARPMPLPAPVTSAILVADSTKASLCGVPSQPSPKGEGELGDGDFASSLRICYLFWRGPTQSR